MILLGLIGTVVGFVIAVSGLGESIGDGENVERIKVVLSQIVNGMGALAEPERITHLVLIDTAGFGKEIAPFLRLMSLPFVGELAERQATRSTSNMLRQIFAGKNIATEALTAELVRTRSLPGARTAVLKTLREGVNIFGMKRKHRLLSRLPDLPMPLMVVWGDRDRFFPLAHAYAAAEMVPSTRLLVIPDAGHWPHMEEPDVFNAAMTAFLNESPSE